MNTPSSAKLKKFAAISSGLLKQKVSGNFRMIGRLTVWVNKFMKAHAFPIACIVAIIFIPLLVRSISWLVQTGTATSVAWTEGDLKSAQQAIKKEIAVLEDNLNKKTPKSFYLVINSASNEFILYNGKEKVKRDKCSTGSYILLKNGEDQQWMFKTPTGEFRIRGKTTSPIWKKPDWAFVEEGLPVPALNHSSRYEYGVLGDYALSLGDGYLIHGTLYQRFLGLPVTHGCIRLSDENLELVYGKLNVGSKVYIF